MYSALGAYALAVLINAPVQAYFAFLEWTLTLLLISWFAFASFDNDYYRSVHRYPNEE